MDEYNTVMVLGWVFLGAPDLVCYVHTCMAGYGDVEPSRGQDRPTNNAPGHPSLPANSPPPKISAREAVGAVRVLTDNLVHTRGKQVQTRDRFYLRYRVHYML